MRWSLGCCVLALGLGTPLPAQGVYQEAVTELAARQAQGRPGVRHAGVCLHCVDEGGAPVPGAQAVLFSIPEGWGPAPKPLDARTTDATGRVLFPKFDSPDPVACRIEAPGRQVRIVPVDIPSGAQSDLGEVRLSRAVTLTGRVEVVGEDGKATPLETGSVTVSLPGKDDEDRTVLGRANLRSGNFALGGVEPHAEVRVEVGFLDGLSMASFHGQIRLEKDRKVALRARKKTLSWVEHRREGRLDVEDAPDLEVDVSPTELRGRVLDGDGRPVAGCRVHGFDSILRELTGPQSWDVTDDDGGFSIQCEDMLRNLVVESAVGSWQVGLGKRLEASADGPFEIRLEPLHEVSVEVAGAREDAVSFSWQGDDTWIRCSRRDVGRCLGEDVSLERTTSGLPRRLRAEVAGWIPQVFLQKKTDQPARFVFENGTDFSVRAVSGRTRLAGAWLDVELLEADGRVEVLQTTTDAQGRVKLQAHAEHAYEVFAYAPGHEPAFARWVPGRELVLDLPLSRQDVSFTGLAEGERVRVQRSGSPAVMALATAAAAHVELSFGSYDVIVLDAEGGVARGLPLEVQRGTRKVALAADRRPAVVLQLPEGELAASWSAGASRGMPAYGPAGAMVATSRGAPATGEPSPSLERPAQRELRLVLPAAGRWVVRAAANGLPFSLVREVTVGPGAVSRLAVPELMATVSGPMLGYEGDQRPMSFHGVATPRLMLVAADRDAEGTAWDVVVGLPERVAGGSTFELGPIPEHPFFGHEHLSHAKDGAWGGPLLEVEDGGTLDGLAGTDPKDLEVHVLDSKGRHLSGATLRVHDPMSEAWQAFRKQPTTATFAADAIPRPPAVRLEGGPVHLPRVRPGHLEIEITTDAGRRFRLHRITKPDQPLRITLPLP